VLFNDYLLLVAWNNQQISDKKSNNQKAQNWTTSKRVRIHPPYSATSLSHDRWIKMEQTYIFNEKSSRFEKLQLF